MIEMSPSDKKKIIIFYIVVCNVLKKITALYIEIKGYIQKLKTYKNAEELTQSSFLMNQIRSDQSLSRVWLFATPWIPARQASLSITNSRSSSNSCPSSQWCHPAISFSVVPFSSCPQSLPASESFPMSQLFPWGGQSTGVSPLASFLPKKSQGWSPLGWTGWISLQSKRLSRVFSNTTVQKHQFFGAQLFF